MQLLKIRLMIPVTLTITYWVAMLSPYTEKMIEPELVSLPAGEVTYRPAGDFARGGQPINGPLKTSQFPRGLRIMKHQISQVEYQQCIEDRACPPEVLPSPPSVDEPIVSVSWRDAEAYSQWLSRKTGRSYRLPTDGEWAFASGSRFRDEGWPDFDGRDPAKRWLARYDSESAREKIDSMPRAIGSFGANENGVLDVAGNVWEWSNTCFARIEIDDFGAQTVKTTNCGVRVVEGRHRTYVTDFIRDARAGGCSVGTPPANLGFRLVRID